MQFKPYKARGFRIMERSKSVDQSLFEDEKGKFLSVAGKVQVLSEVECKDLYKKMSNLNLEILTLYEGYCAKLTTKTINYNLTEYSYYYKNSWEEELPSLLSEYSIVKNKNELETNDKWILVVDEHWGIMN